VMTTPLRYSTQKVEKVILLQVQAEYAAGSQNH
jgi:hypothetical protein